MSNQPSVLPQWIVALSAASGAITIGTCYGLSSVLIPALQEETNPLLRITLEEGSIIVTLWVFGIIFGAIYNGIVSEVWGRKVTMISSQIPFIISYVMIATAPNLLIIYIARLISGFADGAMFSNLPVYIGEISHPKLRGTLVNLVNIFQSLGMVLVYILGALFPWRITNWICVAINILSLILMCLVLPETPFFKVAKNADEEARNILQKLRGKHWDVSQELSEIIYRRNFLQKQKDEDLRSKFWVFLSVMASVRFWKPFAIAAGMYQLVLLTGTGTLNMYLVTIFQESGTDVNPYVATILVGLLKTCMGIIGSYSLQVFPRRALFMTSCLVMAFFMAALGAVSSLKMVISETSIDLVDVIGANSTMLAETEALESSKDNVYFIGVISWAPVIAMIGVYSAFSVGVETVVRCVCAEIFPSDIRSVGNALTILITTASLIALGLLMPIMLSDLGFSGTFFVLSLISIVACTYSFFVLPECKGKSLTRIEEDLDEKPTTG